MPMISFQGDDGRLLIRGSDIAVVSEHTWNERDGGEARQVRIELSNGSIFPVKETWDEVMAQLQRATKTRHIVWNDDGTSSTCFKVSLKDVLNELDDDAERQRLVVRLSKLGYEVPAALLEEVFR